MIKGNLVGLRAIEETDLSILQGWRNQPNFRKHFREIRELSIAHQTRWFQDIVLNSQKDFMFVIEHLETKEPMGVCGLVYVNWVIRSADVSFYIGYNNYYIDQCGIAEEAAYLLFRYGFNNLNLNKLWMELYEFDRKKMEFFAHVGFKNDGILRENCFEDGRYWDSYIYSLLRNEWKNSDRELFADISEKVENSNQR